MNFFQKIFNQTKSVIGSKVGVFNWAIPTDYSAYQQLEQYKRYVYSIVAKNAEDFAKVDFTVERGIGESRKPVTNHPLIELLKRPNPEQSQFQFLELHQTYMLLSGQSFWYLVPGSMSGDIKELRLIRPDLMTVLTNDDAVGSVRGYALKKFDGNDITFKPEEILHFKLPNPKNPYYGMGVVEAGSPYIQTEEFATKFSKSTLYNAGRPSGVLDFKGMIKDEEWKQVQKKIANEYTGPENSGKLMAINGSNENGSKVEFTKFGVDLNGAELKEIKDITKEDLMFMFRTSKTMLGITDDVNRANAREARVVWMENVIKPQIERMIDHINAFLMPKFKGPFANDVLWYADPSPKPIEDRIKEWEQGHNKWLTTNEIRLERNDLFNSALPELEGGDEIYQPLSLTPLASSGQKDKPNDNNDNNKDDNKDATKEVDLDRKLKATQFMEKLFGNQAKWEIKFTDAMKTIFDAQEKEILSRPQNKGIIDWLFDLSKSKSLYFEIFTPLMYEVIKDQSKIALEMAGDTDTELEINQAVQSYVRERVEKFATEVDELTTKQLSETIADGVREGDSLAKMRKRVKEVFKEANNIRAERIARTETLSASNESALESYKQSPLVVAQEWSAESNACEFCQALDGKIISLSSNYANLGDSVEGKEGGVYNVTFESLRHPPLHPNCRCSILPVSQVELVANNELINKLESMYEALDKRTNEAKAMKEQIEIEKKKLALEWEEIEKTIDFLNDNLEG